MNCIVKRIALRRLNALLDSYRDNVSAARTTAATWAGRCRSLGILLDGLVARLEDSNLSEDELRETVNDVRTLIQAW